MLVYGDDIRPGKYAFDIRLLFLPPFSIAEVENIGGGQLVERVVYYDSSTVPLDSLKMLMSYVFQ
jgi:hypothetical protein